MLKKRIVFTLLYDCEYFVLSRNFRLQKVGKLDWLEKHYGFSHIAFYIDELVVLDVTRGQKDSSRFCANLEALTQGCFVPIAAGGGVRNVSDARRLLHSGADKVIVNTALFDNPDVLVDLTSAFGQQCIIGSVDIKKDELGNHRIYTNNGSQAVDCTPRKTLAQLPPDTIGELYLNSIDKDGTGQGYDLDLLDLLPEEWSTPVILAGGVGNSSHLIAGLHDPRVDATATAHLFNFVGDGLQKTRDAVQNDGISLATWPSLKQLALHSPPDLSLS